MTTTTTVCVHSLNIDSAGNITLSGVTEVISLTDGEAIIDTDKGRLVIKGKGLSLSKLDREQGKMSMSSEFVGSLVYGAGKKPFNLKTLFS